METYKNSYTVKEDEVLWELHEIRHAQSDSGELLVQFTVFGDTHDTHFHGKGNEVLLPITGAPPAWPR